MLPSPHRLPLRFERHRLTQSGHRLTSPHLTLIFAPRSNPKLPTRLAVILTRKHYQLATGRNRFRRQFLGALSSHLPHLHPGHDALFLLHRRPTDFQLLPAEIASLLKTSHLLHA